MVTIADNLQAVRARIAQAATAANRLPQSVQLLAVSKTFSAAEIEQAWHAGQHAFGENFVQEGVTKITALSALAIEWHFIGPLQSNKTRPVAEHFAWVHSIGREKIARRLNDARPPQLPPLNVLIQVNVSGESSKSGVAPGEELGLAAAIRDMPRLRLRGLLDGLRENHPEADTLSMGMSADLEAAIAEGSTLVRVGTAIFGNRYV